MKTIKTGFLLQTSNLMTTWPSDFTAFTNPAVDLLSFSIKFNPDTATNLASNHDPTKILITKNVIKIFSAATTSTPKYLDTTTVDSDK